MKAEITYLAGVEKPKAEPSAPFDTLVLDFLEALSKEIRRDRESLKYPEMAAFGFWIRRAHVEEFKKRYEDGRVHIGRGVVFHMAASNVPLLFAYSMVMGLLAGNSCVVRISIRCQEEDFILCEIIDNLLNKPPFASMRDRISVFSCERDHEIVRSWAEACDGLMIWGGDETISVVRKWNLRPDGVSVMFPDRYSICILDQKTIARMQGEELRNLAHSFVNDTYAMDQNACSSPRYIIWNQGEEKEEAEAVHRMWWEAVEKEAVSYDLSPHKATKKYEALCRYNMTMEGIIKTERYGNLVYTILLSGIPKAPETYRGTWGLFFEYQGDYRKVLKELAVSQLQTVTYYGLESKELMDYVMDHHLYGIHRIIPVGNAMNMDLIWDGQDTIRMLSREIIREEEHGAV